VKHSTWDRTRKEDCNRSDESAQRITFPLNDFTASLKMGRNFEDSFATANSKI
jgi:hypothetical protein